MKSNRKEQWFYSINPRNEAVRPSPKRITKSEREEKRMKSLDKEYQFVLQGLEKKKPEKYNALLDKHCKRFLTNNNNISYFKEKGLVTDQGYVISEPERRAKKKNHSCIESDLD